MQEKHKGIHHGQRLKALLSEFKVDRQEFAAKLGIQYAALAYYYHLDSFSTHVKSKVFPALADYGINAEYIENDYTAKALDDVRTIEERMIDELAAQTEILKKILGKLSEK